MPLISNSIFYLKFLMIPKCLYHNKCNRYRIGYLRSFSFCLYQRTRVISVRKIIIIQWFFFSVVFPYTFIKEITFSKSHADQLTLLLEMRVYMYRLNRIFLVKKFFLEKIYIIKLLALSVRSESNMNKYT